MDKKQIITSVKKYSDILLHYSDLNIELIILYGSYVKGYADENSDIDVAVVVKKIRGNYLSIITKLNKLTRTVDDRIEPVLFEMNSDKSGFLNQILKEGEIIFRNSTI